ncbi:Uncharacterised protein [Bordetella ansorpii]|uniref:DUF4303 domain-containing protein n=1 Tax=Bordetella ansorpii TaxID=288768 RepID=A0A157RN86_9BORD|nr:DUF4303 domain-containing protein [Bordetella ansorpii]SAI59437.1 Uncharacterised protein [Bordetella ansorpii]
MSIYNALHEPLKEGVKAAWRQLCQEADPRDIYVFAIDPGDDLGTSVSIAANTESTLSDCDSELERLELRWSMPDWTYAFFGDEELSAFNDAFSADHPDPYALDDEQAETHIEAFFGLCVSVLRELDAEGLFGTGAQRERLLLGVIWSDQSDDSMVDFASQTNAAPQVEAFRQALMRLRELQGAAYR